MSKEEETELPPQDVNDPFYSAGLTEQSQQALDYVDAVDQDNDAEVYNDVYLKRVLLRLETAISNNLEQREEFASQPIKFMESEAELDQAIKGLSVLTSATHLYDSFIKSDSLNSLLSLFYHRNSDIVERMLTICMEMVDIEDVPVPEATKIANELFKSDIIEQLSKLLEKHQFTSKRAPEVNVACALIDNLSDIYPKKMLRLLPDLGQICPSGSDNGLLDIHQAAIASSLNIAFKAQSVLHTLTKKETDLAQIPLVKYYNDPDPPHDEDDREYGENATTLLRVLARDSNNKKNAVESEILDSCSIYMYKSKYMEEKCWQIVKDALLGLDCSAICTKAYHYFGHLMCKYIELNQNKRVTNCVLSAYSSLLKWLPFDSEERSDLLETLEAKHWQRIIGFRIGLSKALAKVERQEFADDDDKQQALEAAGRPTLLDVDCILAWLSMEVEEVESALKTNNLVDQIKQNLLSEAEDLEELASMEEVPDESEDSYRLAMSIAESKETQEMLRTLAQEIAPK